MNEPAVQASPITVCTLWEKDFHKGVGTLVNSLARVGYTGKVWAGYRGELPPWASGGVTTRDMHTVQAGEGIEVVFVRLTVSIHFCQYKSTFMNRIMNDLEPTAQGIYYLDPDMFVLGRWSFFEQWLSFGVACCEDTEYPLNPTHPLVLTWKRYAETLGYKQWNFPGAAFNSGLVGVRREQLDFLDLWQAVLDAIRRDFDTGNRIKMDARTDPFYGTDQDALTFAASLTPHPVSWVGIDGMSFGRGEWLTNHAYFPKPWRKRVIADWLRDGQRPNAALKLYWSLAGGPLRIESHRRIQLHRVLIPLVAFLSRFYRRV